MGVWRTDGGLLPVFEASIGPFADNATTAIIATIRASLDIPSSILHFDYEHEHRFTEHDNCAECQDNTIKLGLTV